MHKLFIILILSSALFAENYTKLKLCAEPSFSLVPYKDFNTFGGSLKIGLEKKYHYFGISLLNIKENYVKSDLKLMGGFLNYSFRRGQFKELLFVYPELLVGYAYSEYTKIIDNSDNSNLDIVDSVGEKFLIGGIGIRGGIGYKFIFLTFGYNLLVGNSVVNIISTGIEFRVNVK